MFQSYNQKISYHYGCSFSGKYTIFHQNLPQGEKIEEPNFWEDNEPLPNVILDASTKLVEENNKKTQPTESESISDLPEKDLLLNDLEHVVYSRRKILGKSKDTLIIPTRYQTEAQRMVLLM